MSPSRTIREDGPGRRLGERALAELAEAERLFASTGEALHHGIHFGRKALRRCRAALALGRERFGERGQCLDRRLRRILRSLSRERDAQAVIERLDALLGEGRLRPEIADPIRTALLARRDRILARRLARDPGLAGLRTRLRAITRAVARLPWSELDEDELRRALLRQRRRALRAGARAEDGGEEELHRYRRRLAACGSRSTCSKRRPGAPMRAMPFARIRPMRSAECAMPCCSRAPCVDSGDPLNSPTRRPRRPRLRSGTGAELSPERRQCA